MCVLFVSEISAETPSCSHRTSLLLSCVWPCCCRPWWGGWGGKEWLGLAVKSPSDNELSSTDWSSHASTQTSRLCATDPLFTLIPYNVFIHKTDWTHIKVWPLTFSIRMLRVAFGSASGPITLFYCPTHPEPSLGSKLWPFELISQRSRPIKSLNVKRRGKWTPLAVHYSFLSLLVCVSAG